MSATDSNATTTPETIAQAIDEKLGRTINYGNVETAAAAGAAALIGELL